MDTNFESWVIGLALIVLIVVSLVLSLSPSKGKQPKERSIFEMRWLGAVLFGVTVGIALLHFG